MNIQESNSVEKKKKIYPSYIDVLYKWQELKKTGYSNRDLYIKEVPIKGLGVFSSRDIKEGEIVELCHCLPIETPNPWMRDKGIKKYSYWEGQAGFVPFGFGAIYNAADREHLLNIKYFLFPTDRILAYVAQKDIPADQELLTWWGEGYYKGWCHPDSKIDV
jgi:hypothetical protein